jgi:hypothetical protein
MGIDTVEIRGVEVYAERSFLLRTYSTGAIWLGDYKLTPRFYSSYYAAEQQAEVLNDTKDEGDDSVWTIHELPLLDVYYIRRDKQSTTKSEEIKLFTPTETLCIGVLEPNLNTSR